MKSKPCKTCQSVYHTSFSCPNKPRKGLKKIGPVTKKWIAVRDKWLEVNKAPYYFCYYCDKMMTYSQLTLDHKLSRSRRPDLRYDWHNLVPCCYNCNQNKGSLSDDEYLIKLAE